MQRKSTDPADYEVSPHGIVAMPKDFRAGFRIRPHVHRRAQLIYATSGVMEVTTADGLWLLPPRRAVYMPAGTPHGMRARGDVALRTLYIAEGACPSPLPSQPRSVHVSNLLGELILKVAGMPLDREPTGHERRVLDLLRDEMTWTAGGIQRLPMPGDRRLAALCRALVDAPGDRRDLEAWGEAVGASPRTLARLFRRELGSSFLLWRGQVRALSAVPRLAAGEPVGTVAADLGYETPGAFAAMFRRLMGERPSRYRAGPEPAGDDGFRQRSSRR